MRRSLRCPSTDTPASPGGQGRAPPGAPLTPVAAAQPSWGLRGQRVPGRSRQTQAAGKGAETLPGSLGAGLWAHAQCPLERGRGTPPQGPTNSAGRQGPRGQKHTLAHPRTHSLPHPSRHLGQLPRRGAGSGLAPQLALKIHSAPSGSRPRKVLFTRSLPAARAGWQLALVSAGSSWLGGWEEVMLPADTWREAAWPGRLPAGPCGRVHGRCTLPLPGARRTLAAGTKPSSGHRPRKMVTGRREDGTAKGPAAGVPVETQPPPGPSCHTGPAPKPGRRVREKGVAAASLRDKSVQADRAWTPKDHPAGSARCHPPTRGG